MSEALAICACVEVITDQALGPDRGWIHVGTGFYSCQAGTAHPAIVLGDEVITREQLDAEIDREVELATAKAREDATDQARRSLERMIEREVFGSGGALTALTADEVDELYAMAERL